MFLCILSLVIIYADGSSNLLIEVWDSGASGLLMPDRVAQSDAQVGSWGMSSPATLSSDLKSFLSFTREGVYKASEYDQGDHRPTHVMSLYLP